MSEVKILLCDDDPDLQGLLVRRLKKMGIEPDAAGDGRKAKGFVDENVYDVIVTDIYMPEATGLEVMEHAKQKDPDTQVVIITSSATIDNAIDALNHGAFGYLTKPFDHLIVFDNMVSRALEYRQLVVADKRKAEAQRRRGDMLEDEVAQRVQQLQKNQKGLLDLLGSLPDGILVVEEGGKVVLSSPVGERWLAMDQKSEDQPIHNFIKQVHAEIPEPTADVIVNGVDLHIVSADFRDDGEVKRKAVIIREVEEDGVGAGSMVTETVMGIKKGLATLYEQGMGTEVVLDVASQFAVLEQLQGWSTGTGELDPEQANAQPAAEVEAPTPSQAPEVAAEPIPAAEVASEPAPAPDAESESIPAPEPAAAPESGPALEVAPVSVPSQEPAAAPGPAEPVQAPAAQAEATHEAGEPVGTTTIPPFTLPRERTPTGELKGPRLNTSELQNALRASAPADETAAEAAIQDPSPQEAIEPTAPAELPVEEAVPQAPATEANQEASTAEIPAAEIVPDPMDETLVSSSSKEAEAPGSIEDTVAPPDGATEETIPPFHADEPFAEIESTAEQQPAADTELEIPSSPTAPDSLVEEQASVEIPDLSAEDQEPEFPRAETDTGDVPSWIDGITGITDPDILQDFDFEPEQQEAAFPAAQNGEILDDDSMFKQRVIPEAMNAKLNTPTELPNINGNQEHVPPQHDGPITIQAAQADTEMFRNVLAGLSGTQILSGDSDQPPGEPPKKSGDAVAEGERGLDRPLAAEDGLNELRAAASDAQDLKHSVPDEPIEAPSAEIAPPAPIESPPVEAPLPSTEELRQAPEPEPEPEPVHAKPANWPPTLPTKDDDWDDELDISA